MATIQKLEAKVEADGRTAYIVGGVLKVYDQAEALEILNPANLAPANPPVFERRAVKRPLAPPNGRGILERFPWENS